MYLTPEDIKVLRESSVYQKYATKDYASITSTEILASLDAIPKVNTKNWPLIKFLSELLFNKKMMEDHYNNFSAHKSSLSTLPETIKAEIGDYADDTVVHDNGAILEVSITLSSGAATNTEVIPALASNQCFLLWIVLNATAAPASAYTLTFHSTDATNKIITVVPGDLGKKFWVMFDGDTDNTNIQVDSAGGAGAEILTLTAFGGTFT